MSLHAKSKWFSKDHNKWNYLYSAKKHRNTKVDWNRYFTSVKSVKERKTILTRCKDILPHNRIWGGGSKNYYGCIRFEADLGRIRYQDLFHWSNE